MSFCNLLLIDFLPAPPLDDDEDDDVEFIDSPVGTVEDEDMDTDVGC